MKKFNKLIGAIVLVGSLFSLSLYSGIEGDGEGATFERGGLPGSVLDLVNGCAASEPFRNNAIHVGAKAAITLEQLHHLFGVYRRKGLQRAVSRILETQWTFIFQLELVCSEEDAEKREEQRKKLVEYLKCKFSLYYGSVPAWFCLFGRSVWVELYNYWYNSFSAFKEIAAIKKEVFFDWNKDGIFVKNSAIFSPFLFPVCLFFDSEERKEELKVINTFGLKILEELGAGACGNICFLKMLDSWNADQLADFLVENLKALKEILGNRGGRTQRGALRALLGAHYARFGVRNALRPNEGLRKPVFFKTMFNILGYFGSSFIKMEKVDDAIEMQDMERH